MIRRHLTLVGLLALTACGPKEIKYDVKIITSSCDPKVDPFAGVKFLRVRITGDGLTVPLESVAPTSGEHTVTIPAIPSGKNRVIDVRGFDNDPTAGGKVVSVGRSLPFEVLDMIDPAMNEPIAVSIFLRKVNAFTPPSTSAAPKECQRMKLPRAGHTATLLKNGKIYIAGGYNFLGGNPMVKAALSEAELYNPATNSFESAKEMSTAGGTQKLPKAFHTATALQSGQVLLWGGEAYTGGTTVSPTAVILVYDPDVNDYGVALQRKAPEPAPIARTGHKAVIDKNGKVLVVGGRTRTAGLTAINEVEWFNPSTNEYKVIGGVQLPRVDPSVAAVKGGELIAVAGGTDGTAMANEVVYFKWNGTSFQREMLATPPRLAAPGRRGAAAATLRDGLDLVVLGGYSDPDPSKIAPIASSEIVGTTTTTVTAGPTVGSSGPNGRGDICTVQLNDGTILAIGGQTVDITGAPGRSDASTLIVKSTGSGGAQGVAGPDLAVPRFQHTCTLMQDGSVLVLGGLNEQIATHEVLQDAWIYQPTPTDL